MDFSTLSGSPMGAGLNFGQSPGANTPSPKKASSAVEAVKREQNGVLPLTVKQYLAGTETFVDGKMVMYGLATPKVSIVGLVEKVENSPACHEYIVNDFSGSVTVQSYSPDILASNPGAGELVRVVGEPREGGFMSAINISVEKDPAALNAHRLQAILALCNASQVVPLNYETPVKTESTKAPEQPVAVKREPASTQPLSGAELITGIKVASKRRKVVVPAGDEEQGTKIADIVADLAGQASEKDVRDCVSKLLEDGSAYESWADSIAFCDE
jgi:hypothetical protein